MLICWAPQVLPAPPDAHSCPAAPIICCAAAVQNYLTAIKGVGIYRANSGPHDEPRWEAYNAARK